MRAKYHFLSSYRLSASPDAVWRVLGDVAAWPSWWRWLRRIDTVRAASSEDGVGAAYVNHMRSPLGVRFTYTTTVTAAESPRWIDVASTGDLEGRGRFLLLDAPDGGTDLSYTWLVETTKPWMNLIAPLGRPAFRWNHDRLMTDFGHGVAATAGGSVTAMRHEILRPGAPGYFEMPTIA